MHTILVKSEHFVKYHFVCATLRMSTPNISFLLQDQRHFDNSQWLNCAHTSMSWHDIAECRSEWFGFSSTRVHTCIGPLDNCRCYDVYVKIRWCMSIQAPCVIDNSIASFLSTPTKRWTRLAYYHARLDSFKKWFVRWCHLTLELPHVGCIDITSTCKCKCRMVLCRLQNIRDFITVADDTHSVQNNTCRHLVLTSRAHVIRVRQSLFREG